MRNLRAAVVQIAAIGACWLVLAGSIEAEQFNPRRPVLLVVGSSPGSFEDQLARRVAPLLRSTWRQEVVVDNAVGAGGLLAAAKVTGAVPDGQTLLVGSIVGQVLSPLFSPSGRPPDPLKDLTPLIQLARVPILLVVGREKGIERLSELIQKAKARPGAFTYAAGGTGSLPHLMAELFMRETGTKIVQVPFRGTAAIQEIVSGSVDLAFIAGSSAIIVLRERRVRALAVSGNKRLPGEPLGEVPLFQEREIKGMDGEYWYGLFGPPRMHGDTVQSISNQVRKALLEDREIGLWMNSFGGELQLTNPVQFSEFVRKELIRWAAMSKSAKIRLD